MAIKINWKDLQKRIINGKEVEKVMYNGVQIRPSSTPPTPTFDDYLYFQIQPQGTCHLSLIKQGNPTNVSLEISYDKQNWMDYTIDSDIEITHLTNIYFRNKSEVPTWFSNGRDDCYHFEFYPEDGSSADLYCGGDVTSLLCKNWTTTLTSDYCFANLFYGMPIITTPKLPATTLTNWCYMNMFYGCTLLTTAPQLPATTLNDGCYFGMFGSCGTLTTPPQLSATNLADQCYDSMFQYCTALSVLPSLPAINLGYASYESMFAGCFNIKLSDTQIWDYQTPYRIPTSGTSSASGNSSAYHMFYNTWWTFRYPWTPNINQTYYTSNTVI